MTDNVTQMIDWQTRTVRHFSQSGNYHLIVWFEGKFTQLGGDKILIVFCESSFLHVKQAWILFTWKQLLSIYFSPWILKFHRVSVARSLFCSYDKYTLSKSESKDAPFIVV